MFGCEEEEFYDPDNTSSPPSPADEEIVVNKSVNLQESSVEEEENKQNNPKVASFYPSGSKTTEGPWLESDFRNAQVMDQNKRQILYEKLQKYADSWSVPEPESESSERFYDVDSGSDSVEELELNDERHDTKPLSLCNGQGDGSNVDTSSDLARENIVSPLQERQEGLPSDCSLVNMRNQQIVGTNINSNSTGDSGITSPTGTFDGDLAILDLCNDTKKQERTVRDGASNSKSTELTNNSVSNYPSLQDNSDHNEDCEDSLTHGTKEYVVTKEETRQILYSSVDESVQTSDPDSLHRRLEECSKNELQYTISDNKNENKHKEWNVLNRIEEDDEGSGKKLVRSTSLKSGKTPPGTPSRKKIVRFADALGLDLEAVRHIGSEDDEPNVPASAFKDLKVTTHEPCRSSTTLFSRFNISSPFTSSLGVHAPSHSTLTLIPIFPQPVTQHNFLDRVRNNKICLENIIVSDLNVQCHVRVLNISFEKLVLARYTTNEWLSYEDVLANYVIGSCDGFSDKFSWNFFVPHMSDGQRLIFAVRLVANGQEFWDSNDGKNYVLRCHSHSSGVFAPTEESSSWMHHFM